MNDRNLVRGLFLMAISLAFGLQSLRYPIGQFSHAGAGLFPLIVSGLLFVVGVVTVVRARFVARVPLDLHPKNILLIIASLCGFVVISKLLNMILGIVFLVFCAAYAGSTYSIVRNLKVAIGLILVALAFQRLLGLNLPLY